MLVFSDSDTEKNTALLLSLYVYFCVCMCVSELIMYQNAKRLNLMFVFSSIYGGHNYFYVFDDSSFRGWLVYLFSAESCFCYLHALTITSE